MHPTLLFFFFPPQPSYSSYRELYCYVRGRERTKMYVCIFIIFTLVAILDQTQRDTLAKEAFSYLEYPSSKSYTVLQQYPHTTLFSYCTLIFFYFSFFFILLSFFLILFSNYFLIFFLILF
jgi:hypothetical protein